ncbi:MAG: hypothetical protein GX367_02865, partial [Bacteroidales bacterium]|nr:hypothetical protein [Bacteroidales bacterium]
MEFKKRESYSRKLMSLFLVVLMVLSNFPIAFIDKSYSKVSALEASQLAVVVKGVDDQSLTAAEVKLLLGEEVLSTAVYHEDSKQYLFLDLEDLPEGEYSILVNHNGYNEEKLDITFPDNDNPEKVINLAPILVSDLTIKMPEVDDYFIAAKYQFSADILPMDALNQEIQWSCSSDKATIDSTGLLSISEEMEEGVIQITATALGSDSNSPVTKEVEITVKNGTLLEEDYTLSQETINNWFKSDVIITPNAEGANGYDKIKVGEEWLDSYTTGFEGTQDVVFYLKNSSTGVISQKKTLSLSIDKSNPQILEINLDNTNWAKNRNISFKVEDSQSGISKVYWSKEDNAETGTEIEAVSGLYSFVVTENGTYYIYAVDKVGNKTKVDVEVEKLDNTIPEIRNISKDPSNQWSNTAVRIEGQVPRLDGTALSSVKYSIYEDFTDVKEAIISLDETGSVDSFVIESQDQEFEGIYYIKAYDELGNESDTVEVSVKIDKEDPTIKESDIIFEPYETSGIKKLINVLTFGNFFNEEIKVTIKAEDNLSGIDKIIYYTSSDEEGHEVIFNGESEANSDGEISFQLPIGFEGYVFAKAVDKAGNAMKNEVRTNTITLIENIEPTVDIYINDSNKAYDGWFTTTPKVEIKVSDIESGINKIEYVVKKEDNILLEYSINLATTMESNYDLLVNMPEDLGELLVKVTVTDNAGNETIKEATIKIDNKKPLVPTVNTAYDGSWTKDGIVYNISMPALYEQEYPSGISAYEYRVFRKTEEKPDGDWTDWISVEPSDSTEIVISSDEYQGSGKVKFRAVSGAGLISEESEEFSFKRDSKVINKARVTFDETVPKSNDWYKATKIDAKIAIEKEEDRAKNGFRYRVNQGAWSSYVYTDGEEAFVDLTITGEGKHLLEIQSVDELGNGIDSEPEVYEVKLDNTPPKIDENKIEFRKESSNVIETFLNLISFGLWFNETLEVTVLADDINGTLDVSGVDKIAWYTETLNGEKSEIKEEEVEVRINEATGEEEYYIQFEIAGEFEGYLYLMATDKANNSMSWMKMSEKMGIDTQKPSVEVEVIGSNYTNRLGELWFNTGDLKVAINAWDNGASGLTSVEYDFDGEVHKIIKSRDFVNGKYTENLTWGTWSGIGKKVTVTAKDNAKNIVDKDKIVNIDTNTPSIPTVSIKDNYTDAKWTNKDVVFELDATYDPNLLPSGIDGYKYFDLSEGENAAWKFVAAEKDSSVGNLILDKDGVHQVEFKAVSGAGLLSDKTATYIAKIDKTAPKAPVIKINDNILDNDNNENTWYKDEKVEVFFSVEVDDTGNTAPIHVEYSLDGGLTYKKATSLEGEGNKGIYYVEVEGEKKNELKVKAVDEAMNESEVVELYVNIDTTEPEIESITFKPDNTSTTAKVINMLSFGNFFNEKVKVTVKAKDNHPADLANQMAGIDTITYYTAKDPEGTLDKSDEITVTANGQGEISFYLEPEFEGYVFVKAKDKAQNEMGSYVRKGTNSAEGSIDTDKILIIEKELPNIEITHSAATGEYVNKKWYNGNINVGIKV